MGILDGMFGRKQKEQRDHEGEDELSVPLPATPATADWRRSKAHLELLARFFRGADPWSFIEKEHWNDVLDERVDRVIERLRVEGALVEAPPAVALRTRYSQEDLRYFCSERGLNAEGSEDELIARLLERDPAGMARLTAEINVLLLGADARRAVVRYVKSERERRETAERKCLVGLLQRDYLRAALAVGEFQSDSVFSRGVGVGFTDEDHLENVQLLQFLFEKTPALLSDESAETLDALRSPAGMSFLWGRDSAAPWIPGDVHLAGALSADRVCAMLLGHARYLLDIGKHRRGRYRVFEIWSARDSQSCGACGEFRGQQFTLDTLPELPHAQCSSALGCRCHVVVSEHAF